MSHDGRVLKFWTPPFSCVAEPNLRCGAETGGGGDGGLSDSSRLLMSMGFPYRRVVEAVGIYDDQFDDMLCWLLEGEGGDPEGGSQWDDGR